MKAKLEWKAWGVKGDVGWDTTGLPLNWMRTKTFELSDVTHFYDAQKKAVLTVLNENSEAKYALVMKMVNRQIGNEGRLYWMVNGNAEVNDVEKIGMRIRIRKEFADAQ